MEPTTSGMCPCLVPDLDDRIRVYPETVYCRPPSGGIHVPARDTLLRLCTGDYSRCVRYRAELGRTMVAAS